MRPGLTPRWRQHPALRCHPLRVISPVSTLVSNFAGPAPTKLRLPSRCGLTVSRARCSPRPSPPGAATGGTAGRGKRQCLHFWARRINCLALPGAILASHENSFPHFAVRNHCFWWRAFNHFRQPTRVGNTAGSKSTGTRGRKKSWNIIRTCWRIHKDCPCPLLQRRVVVQREAGKRVCCRSADQQTYRVLQLSNMVAGGGGAGD